uniref:Putative secreted protein n=1 Tax=Anopheles marajoara TaxID=58244 RepID=A0A2M4C632_9DIPT
MLLQANRIILFQSWVIMQTLVSQSESLMMILAHQQTNQPARGWWSRVHRAHRIDCCCRVARRIGRSSKKTNIEEVGREREKKEWCPLCSFCCVRCCGVARRAYCCTRLTQFAMFRMCCLLCGGSGRQTVEGEGPRGERIVLFVTLNSLPVACGLWPVTKGYGQN